MGKRTGIFKMASAMAAVLGAGYGAAVSMMAHGRAGEAKGLRGPFEARVKGRNRKRRNRYAGFHPDSSRFDRKSIKFGAEYHPGKLFKGHRI